MPDYISVHTGAVIDNAVTTVINGKAGIQGIISNGTEIEPNQNNKISINIPDISQSTGDSTTSTMSQNAITNQLREKANADLLNNYYQKTESYSKTEIDNMIASIPKFDIKVVLTLPTENISESTIYLVPTQQEEGGLYQEYVYINSRWELIGGQSVDLSDYYNRQTIDSLLDNKLDTDEVVQITGYNTDKVMSQKAVTDIVNDKFDKSSINNYYNKSETDNLLNDRININKIAQDVNGLNADYVVSQSAIKSALDEKIDKSAIVQSAGSSATNIMSQEAVTDLLDTKFDKSSIVQALGNSTTSTMSQNAITENLNGKADKSDLNNYYNKSETYTQAEIDDKITRIPQFNIQVVDELPTTNISPTTVYIVPSSVGDDTIYQEYIYSDNEWKLLGDQTVDLSDYYNKTETDSLLSNKVDKTSIVQTTGDSTTSVMSQDAVTDSLDAKFDKSSIVQITGNSTTSVMSQDAVTDALAGKLGTESVYNELGYDTGWPISQYAVTHALDGKIDKSAIKQEPGDGYNDLMSQKAIRTSLDGKMDWSFYDEKSWDIYIGDFDENASRYYDITDHATFSANDGHCIKIGKICHINFVLEFRFKRLPDPNKYATIGRLPFVPKSNISKQTLSVCEIESMIGNVRYWKPEPGLSFEIRYSGEWAHLENQNGVYAIKWPQSTDQTIIVSGSGSYITEN